MRKTLRIGIRVGLLGTAAAAAAKGVAVVRSRRAERHRRHLDQRRDLWPPVPAKQSSEPRIDGARVGGTTQTSETAEASEVTESAQAAGAE